MKKLLLILLLVSMLSAQEFQVNTYIDNEQYNPTICALKDGKFVIAWESNYQDGSVSGIYAQIFGSNCERIGGEFRVSTYTKNWQGAPYIINLANGDFISFGYQIQKFMVVAFRVTVQLLLKSFR